MIATGGVKEVKTVWESDGREGFRRTELITYVGPEGPLAAIGKILKMGAGG